MAKVVNLSDFHQKDENIYFEHMTRFWESFDLYWELSEGGFHLWSAYVDAGNAVVKSDLPILAAAANLLIIEYNKERILEEGYPEFDDHMTLLSSFYELSPDEIRKMSVKLKSSMMKVGFDISPLAWNEEADELRANEEDEDDDDDDLTDEEFGAKMKEEAQKIMHKNCNIHVKIDSNDQSLFANESEVTNLIKNLDQGIHNFQLIKLYPIFMEENEISFSIDCELGFMMIFSDLLENEHEIITEYTIIRNLDQNCYIPNQHYIGFMDIYRDMNIPELEDEDELHKYLEQFNALSPEERRKQNPDAREDDEYAAVLLYDLPAAEGTKKAKQILKTNPHNIEAKILIAGWEGDLEKRIDLLVAASDIRKLDYDYTQIQKDKMWWGASHTRPFMRAKYLLAKTYEIGGYIDDAIDGYKEIIQMNPSDNQGARTDLMKLLYSIRDTKEIISLTQKFPDEPDPYFAFSAVYASFMKHGKSAKTEKKIIHSIQANYYIASAIAKIDPVPFAEHFDLPEDDDSILCDDFEEVGDDILSLFKNAELLKYYRKIVKDILERVVQ